MAFSEACFFDARTRYFVHLAADETTIDGPFHDGVGGIEVQVLQTAGDLDVTAGKHDFDGKRFEHECEPRMLAGPSTGPF